MAKLVKSFLQKITLDFIELICYNNILLTITKGFGWLDHEQNNIM